eukprot:365031-Chlamydomonas_euryale.AAC.16
MVGIWRQKMWKFLRLQSQCHSSSNSVCEPLHNASTGRMRLASACTSMSISSASLQLPAGASAARGAMPARPSAADYAPWVMEAYSRDLLVDRESGVLYSRPQATPVPSPRIGSNAAGYGAYRSAGTAAGVGAGAAEPHAPYPAAVGRLEGGVGGRAVLWRDDQTDGGQFFKALDTYLKQQRM